MKEHHRTPFWLKYWMLVSGCEVILSTPIKHFDKKAASKIVDAISKDLLSLDIKVIDNQNINSKEVGRKGLHLNDWDIKKVAKT